MVVDTRFSSVLRLAVRNTASLAKFSLTRDALTPKKVLDRPRNSAEPSYWSSFRRARVSISKPGRSFRFLYVALALRLSRLSGTFQPIEYVVLAARSFAY